MNQASSNLFGEPRIRIEGNPLLEGVCNHILELVQRNPELLNGKTVGEIDRQLTLAIWVDNGAKLIVQSGDWQKFSEWVMNQKVCIDAETVGRSRRFLAERDYIRLPQEAIKNAEGHRQRIARSVK